LKNLHTATDKASQLTANRPIVSHTQENLKNELKALEQVEKSNNGPKHCECSPFFKIYVRNSVTGLSYIPNIL
jgi:hypothetical protein